MIRSKALNGLGMGVMALAFAACGGSTDTGGGGGGATPADNTPAAVTIQVEADPTNVGKYSPTPATAKVGDTVKWAFADDASQHTVAADDSSFDSGTKGKGESFTYKFTKAGTFPYHCSLHANMKGTITVS
ncbi:MAG TPA: plastocyanin/azurin family copper-binding protein [Candidatus Dormibacteraeota bacterium]|nr:plastocyanin/azurin family copper-binding protein [Candidatus Dormibacteraeota bacterium]